MIKLFDIPFLNRNFKNEIPNSKETFKVDFNKKKIYNIKISKLNKLVQDIYFEFNIEKNAHIIYPFFGVEFNKLINKPVGFVESELERMVIEILSKYKEVIKAYDFEFELEKDKLKCHLSIDTVYGKTQLEVGEISVRG